VSSTPSKPRQTAVEQRNGTLARKLVARPRKRAAGKDTSDSDGALAPRASVRQTEQIAILALAIICGLIGLAAHVFMLASIVLMSVLLGLIAADVRGRRGRGVISELVAEAKNVADDITSA
jgi:hypothetical protein